MWIALGHNVPSSRFLPAVAGLLWGGSGTVFAQPWFSVSGWQGAALGLVIGVAVARCHDRVAPRGVWGLVWLSGFTFTAAAGAFGAAAQVLFECGWLSRGPGALLGTSPDFTGAVARVFIALTMSVVGVWVLGMFIVFWPLAFVTHFVYWVASDPVLSSEAS